MSHFVLRLVFLLVSGAITHFFIVGNGTLSSFRVVQIVKMRSLLLACVVLAASFAFSQQSSTNVSKSHTIHAQGRGCVRPGKEEGCFVMHDIKKRRLYDLSFGATDSKPDLYTAIWFEGIGYPHDAHCSNGRPVHVIHWKALPGKCSKPETTKANTK